MSTKARKACDKDIEIGKKITNLRIAKGISIKDFAKEIGVTHQQIHKYEKGTNRISAGRLYLVADILKVPITYFFDDGLVKDEAESNNIESRKCMDLVRHFSAIPRKREQEAVSILIKVLAEA